MDSSPGFEGANEPRLLFQAVLKCSLRCICLAEEARRILHQGAVGVTQKMGLWRRHQRPEQPVRFRLPQPGLFVMQLG